MKKLGVAVLLWSVLQAGAWADYSGLAAAFKGFADGYNKRSEELKRDTITNQEIQIREDQNRRAQEIHDAQMRILQQQSQTNSDYTNRERAFRQASWEFFDRPENWIFQEGTQAWVLLDQQSQLLQKTYPDMPPHEILRRARAATIAALGISE